jgi:PAT family beta-lactamase induction signal transducer AmpG
MNKRLLIIFILGFSSGMPLSLITTTLQAWYADVGMSILATGMLSLLGLPYLYRIFWGPILDRCSLLPLGKRRSWILMMQVFLCVGFNILAWCSPISSPKLMAGVAFILACFSATQDVAIDAHRTEYLPISEHGLGASIATLGYRIALLVGGGFALILAQHVGWTATYRCMGLLMLPGMLSVFYSPEPSQPVMPSSFFATYVTPIKELFTRPGIVSLVLFIFFYKLGEAFTTSTSGIVMPFLIQGIGFSLEVIAYVNKIIGVVAIVVGGLLAGYILLRWSIYRALLVFGLLQAATNGLFIALAMVGKNTALFAVAVLADNFAAGMGSTALIALLMRSVDQRFTATQFSILATLSTLPRILSGPIAAVLQSWFGWVGLYQLAFVMALLFIPFLIKISRQDNVNFPTRYSLTDPDP